MTITKLSDVIIPGSNAGVTLNNIIKRKSIVKSKFWQSGIITGSKDDAANIVLNLPAGGKLINIRSRLEPNDAEQIMDDTTDLQVNKFQYNNETTPVYERAQSYGITDLAVDLGGDDPMDDLANFWANYWARRFQVLLINILNGAMSASNISDNVYDISANAGAAAVISGTSFITASNKLGDASDQIVAVAMHSAAYTLLLQQNLISFDHVSDQGKPIPTYMDKEVIVDDGLPYNSGTGVTSMYLFKKGAVINQEGTPKTPVEVERQALINGGEEYVVSRKHFILHPAGFSFTSNTVSGPTPTNTNAALGANWQRVYDPKEIGIIKFTFKLA